MITEAQTKARMRNWQKARLLGFCLDISVLTPYERAKWAMARAVLEEIKENWDSQTEVVTGRQLKPYKCSWCGRRSNKQHLDVDTLENFCFKHYKERENGFTRGANTRLHQLGGTGTTPTRR